MVDDPGAAQARELLRELHGHAADISHKLDTVQRRHRRTSARGAMLDRRQLSSLRQELHEAQRLIEGLHNRFPDRSSDANMVERGNRSIEYELTTRERL